MKRPLVLSGVALAVGFAVALGAWAQASNPINESEVPQRKKAAPLPPRGTYQPRERRGAIRPLPAPTTTATRPASRSSGPKRLRAVRSRASRPTSSPRSRKQRQRRRSSATRRSASSRGPRAHALVRELLRGQQPPVAGLGSARGQSAGADRGSPPARRRPQRPREPGEALPIPMSIAACTTAASRAACRAR